MQALDAILSATPATDPWPARRQRTDELASRYPHAAEMLRLYRALLDPMADAFDAARADGLPMQTCRYSLSNVFCPASSTRPSKPGRLSCATASSRCSRALTWKA